MQTRSIGFHFDYISPYSYLAWHQLKEIAGRRGLRVVPKPTLFAALLNHWGHRGPAEIPPKRLYMFKDCIRTASSLNLPFAPPFSHPFNPLPSLRATVLEMADETRERLVTRLFAAAWAEGLDVGSMRVVARLCEQCAVPGALSRIEEPAVKQRLRESSHEALALGIFGVPTMIVNGELFWGTDSLHHLERYLDGHDPVRAEQMSEWLAVSPSADRLRGR